MKERMNKGMNERMNKGDETMNKGEAQLQKECKELKGLKNECGRESISMCVMDQQSR